MEQVRQIEQESMNFESMTVLFVDDEMNVLRTVKRILRNEPYKVITANSAEEGIETLKKQQVHMIISDQRMPKVTGIEFLEKARDMFPDVIRVMLTGYSDLKTAEQAINKVEIYRFLSKPWNDEDLKVTIRQGLMKWRLKTENERMIKIIEEQNKELRELNQDLEKKVEDRTKELKDAQSQLIQSEKMGSIGLLAGGIAHEINNPLGGIMAVTQILLMDATDDQMIEDLRSIENAVLKCKEITTGLQRFARQGNNQSKEPLDIQSLIQQSLTLIGYIFRSSNITIEQEYEPDLPMVIINANQIQQVIVNILTNAQQATEKGGKISIKGRKSKDGGLTIEFKDSGEGIPEEHLSKIFDPFFTTKPEGMSTGLGLSVSYGIMSDHGGRIEAESEYGKGTCMRMIFGPEQNYLPEEDEKEGE